MFRRVVVDVIPDVIFKITLSDIARNDWVRRWGLIKATFAPSSVQWQMPVILAQR